MSLSAMFLLQQSFEHFCKKLSESFCCNPDKKKSYVTINSSVVCQVHTEASTSLAEGVFLVFLYRNLLCFLFLSTSFWLNFLPACAKNPVSLNIIQQHCISQYYALKQSAFTSEQNAIKSPAKLDSLTEYVIVFLMVSLGWKTQ